MTITINSHPEAAQAAMELWADSRENPDLSDDAKEKLTALMTMTPDLERKVMVPELVFANMSAFDEDARAVAAAMMDFVIQWDFWGMRSSGRGEAIAAALRGIEGAPTVEPLERFLSGDPPPPSSPFPESEG